MAHFYGTLQGARGQASRLGTKASDLLAVAASWEGAVSTKVYFNDDAGCDYARVMLIPWHGNGTSRVLYDGPVSGKNAPDTHA